MLFLLPMTNHLQVGGKICYCVKIPREMLKVHPQPRLAEWYLRLAPAAGMRQKCGPRAPLPPSKPLGGGCREVGSWGGAWSGRGRALVRRQNLERRAGGWKRRAPRGHPEHPASFQLVQLAGAHTACTGENGGSIWWNIPWGKAIHTFSPQRPQPQLLPCAYWLPSADLHMP